MLHHEVGCHSVDHSPQYRLSNQHGELQARDIEHSRNPKRNHEMKHQAKQECLTAAVERRATEQPAGDMLKDTNRTYSPQPKKGPCVKKAQDPNNQPAINNGFK